MPAGNENDEHKKQQKIDEFIKRFSKIISSSLSFESSHRGLLTIKYSKEADAESREFFEALRELRREVRPFTWVAALRGNPGVLMYSHENSKNKGEDKKFIDDLFKQFLQAKTTASAQQAATAPASELPRPVL